MAKVDPDKVAKRNAARRLSYWANRRLKDVIFRRSQLDSWRETIVQVQEQKIAAKAHSNVTVKVTRRAAAEARVA